MSAMPGWTPPTEFDEFRLLAPLGRGGMSQVFTAQDVFLDRLVAVKFLLTAAAAGAAPGTRLASRHGRASPSAPSAIAGSTPALHRDDLPEPESPATTTSGSRRSRSTSSRTAGSRPKNSAQVAVGRGHHPDVDGDGVGAADRLDLAGLQRAQELGLQLERQLGDLVEEERAVIGGDHQPALVVVGARERAAHVAEERRLDERLRHGGAVLRDERPAR